MIEIIENVKKNDTNIITKSKIDSGKEYQITRLEAVDASVTFEYINLDKDGMIYLFLSEPAQEDFELKIAVDEVDSTRHYEILNEQVEKNNILESELVEMKKELNALKMERKTEENVEIYKINDGE